MEVVGKSDYDVIVVGSGPGGATVAREMACRGKKVLILEWGPGGKVRGTATQYLSQTMIPGKSLLLTPELVGMVRGITTGGSSLFYCGTAYPAPLEMLRRYGVDLASEVQEVRAELPIAPLKAQMVTPMTSRLMESARQIGLDWQMLDKFMYQDRWKGEYPGFGWYGDPNGVKWSARNYVEEAVAHGAVLLNGAKVTLVLSDARCASGVEFTMNGRTHSASAGRVVIAAGGIGSPLILRQSGIREAGYDFFFDPLISVCGTLKDVSLRDNEIPMSTGAHLREEGYMMTDLAMPPPLHTLFTAQVLHLNRLFSFRHTARIMVKIRDDLAGRLTDSGGVRKRLTLADRGKLKAGFENARRVLKAAGATDIYKTSVLAAHPGGTAKIGEVVDANLKTRIDNLYVCDCSVIPEAWGLPPTFTLVALGKRLARHFVAEQQPVAHPAAA
jgi:choline dehydrogenase-like flavoprotein